MTTKVKDEKFGIELTLFDMLNELKSYDNLDVYVTGSNSKIFLMILLKNLELELHRFMFFPLLLKNTV